MAAGGLLVRRTIRSRIFLVFTFAVILLIILGNNSSPATMILREMSDRLTSTVFRDDYPDMFIRDVRIKTCSRLFTDCSIKGYRRIEKDLRLDRSWLGKSYIFVHEMPKDFAMKANINTVLLDVHIGPEHPEPKAKLEPGKKEPVFVPDTGRAVPIPVKQEDVKERSDNLNAKEREVSSEEENNDLHVEHQIDNKGTWIQCKNNLWLKFGRPTDFAVSDIDVLYGTDAVDPRFGWSLKGDRNNSLLVGSSVHPRLTIRLGGKQDLPAVKLRAGSQGRFKIIQVADLHFSTGPGKCMDPYPIETAYNCVADARTLSFVNRLLDEEKPNFAVLSGDQVFGDGAPDAQTALFKAVAPFILRKIPFAITFGNHDDEGNLSREDMMEIVTRLPYSLAQSGPDIAKGVGNYYLSVLSPKSDHLAMTLYFLDTHKYSPNPKKLPGYDWIDASQLEFLTASYNQLAPLRKQYTGHHLSMAFFHIPLTEYRNVSNPILGNYREPSTAPKYNTGARSLLSEIDVSVVSVGHDHVNDFCMYDTSYSPSDISTPSGGATPKQAEQDAKDMSIWLCHGGAAGLGGYGGYGDYVRRIRFFEVDTYSGKITSWKRLEHGDTESKIDMQVLVDQGKVIQ
ncbi:Metallo-dependent phosphatase-like protein [Dipodascopsis uninucleata]